MRTEMSGMKSMPKEPTVSPITAYMAMFEFLLQYAKRTHSDDVLALLGDLSVLPDGTTADPATVADWVSALGVVTKEEQHGGYQAVKLKLEH